MRTFVAACVLAGLALSGWAEDADAIRQRVLANRPAKDMTLKGRLFLSREKFVPVEIAIHSTATDTRTLYRGEDTELLVIQPWREPPRYYLKGAGELTGDARLGRLLGSQFTYFDLGLPFLHWPDAKLLGEARSRGRDCHLLEVTATNQPYARVKMWIDREYNALLRVEAYNRDGNPVRRWSVNSFRKVGGVWIPATMEAAFVPAGQALPAEERSKLELHQVNGDKPLAAEQFAPARFAPAR